MDNTYSQVCLQALKCGFSIELLFSFLQVAIEWIPIHCHYMWKPPLKTIFGSLICILGKNFSCQGLSQFESKGVSSKVDLRLTKKLWVSFEDVHSLRRIASLHNVISILKHSICHIKLLHVHIQSMLKQSLWSTMLLQWLGGQMSVQCCNTTWVSRPSALIVAGSKQIRKSTRLLHAEALSINAVSSLGQSIEDDDIHTTCASLSKYTHN